MFRLREVAFFIFIIGLFEFRFMDIFFVQYLKLISVGLFIFGSKRCLFTINFVFFYLIDFLALSPNIFFIKVNF
jgi:hypothetical protein